MILTCTYFKYNMYKDTHTLYIRFWYRDLQLILNVEENRANLSFSDEGVVVNGLFL